MSEHPKWLWNSTPDPFSKTEPPQWTPYSPSDNSIIERAFQRGDSSIHLGNYVIHIADRMQVNKNDFSRQRPIKRSE